VATTRRIRIKDEQYELVKDYAEKHDVTQAEALEQLINGNNTIINGEIEDSSNSGLFWGLLLAGGMAFLSGMGKNDKGGGN